MIRSLETPVGEILFDVRPEYPTDDIVINEIFLEDVYEVSSGRFEESGVTIDLGANIGAFSIYAASHGSHVFAVEPEPNNIEALNKNIELNNMSEKIIVLPYGISDYKGTATITNNGGDSTIMDGLDGTEIEIMPLDNLFSLYKIKKVNVLKIDIEGSEVSAILGASKNTLNKCRYIAIEFDIRTGDRMGDIVRKLSETHHVRTMGSWERGGMIWAWLY